MSRRELDQARSGGREQERPKSEAMAMMDGMGGMMDGMWPMGLAGLLAVVVLVLAIAALVKYVFFR
jgi:hypothetical protein